MTDERMDAIIAKLLRAGVILAAALVMAGGAAYVASSSRTVPDYRQFHPEMRGLRALSSLPWPEALIEIGLLALIATPVARVAFCLAAFALERDRMYLCFTAAVLAVLLYSICTALL
jgi:uncharacterized membrane protein